MKALQPSTRCEKKTKHSHAPGLSSVDLPHIPSEKNMKVYHIVYWLQNKRIYSKDFQVRAKKIVYKIKEIYINFTGHSL